jgi:2'-5' RNA ligase
MRLFVAAWPPADVAAALAALDRPAVTGMRWTTPDQWHVTLRFLGSCNVDDAVRAFETIDSPACGAVLGPVVSRLGRSVVVVPVSGLEPLAADVIRATRDVGRPPEPQRFAGHVTLARLRERSACSIVGTQVSAAFEVGEVHLVRSDLRPDGAVYETIAARSLR